MDDPVSEIIGEYADLIEDQERIAQSERAVVEAAMMQRDAKRDMRKGDRSFKARAERAWRHACVVTEAACAALDRARKGEA